MITTEQIDLFERDGAVAIPGLLTDWVPLIAAGIERNMRERGPYAAQSVRAEIRAVFSTTTAIGSAYRNFSASCGNHRLPRRRRP